MSGLEVLALVAGITSAFTGTASFLAERKKRRAEKARAKAEQLERLQTAVIAAPPQIQNEYDRDFARIGPKFATGDCEFLASIHPTFRGTYRTLLIYLYSSDCEKPTHGGVDRYATEHDSKSAAAVTVYFLKPGY
jgi:hypothetical protein